jgi:hypothetical protein
MYDEYGYVYTQIWPYIFLVLSDWKCAFVINHTIYGDPLHQLLSRVTHIKSNKSVY